MPSKTKVLKWIHDNLVMLVGIPLIVGIHYGWSKLQDVPYLVDQSTKREMPIIAAFKAYKAKAVEKINWIKDGGVPSEPQEK